MRQLLISTLLGWLLAMNACAAGSQGFTQWPRKPAEAVGFDPALAPKLDKGVRDGTLAGLHSVLIARHGHLVVEQYYEGQDERWGDPLGEVAFDENTTHDLRSVSKSIVALLYGIALAEGKVPNIEAVLVDQFPRYADLVADQPQRRITIEHALTMTLGLQWDETLPYSDPRNSEIAMERAEDRYRFVLEREIVEPPGRRWNYSGGSTALIARVIADGTGQPLLAYAREKLFAPLGIEDVEWVQGGDGEPAAASGLRMRPNDLARIGQLILNSGRWGERQVVPAQWLDAMHTPRVPAEEHLWYGYQWWIGHMRKPGDLWVSGFGNGGQRLTIMPSLGLVVVITAGRYNQPEHWRLPVAVMFEFVMPAIRDLYPTVGENTQSEG